MCAGWKENIRHTYTIRIMYTFSKSEIYGEFSVRFDIRWKIMEIGIWKGNGIHIYPQICKWPKCDNESFALIWAKGNGSCFLIWCLNAMDRVGDNKLIKAIYNTGSDMARDLHTVQQIHWFPISSPPLFLSLTLLATADGFASAVHIMI